MSNDHQDRQDRPEQDERTADSAVPATQQIPSDEVPPTQALPASNDPLAVFDEPVRSADSGPEPGPGPATATIAAPPLVRSGPRTTTIVWGLIVVAVGVGILARTAGATIDVELATILLLATAGLLLVVGSVAGAVRRRRRASVTAG
ncbi:hypothetical protein [Isoptericola croceus]|uniref:hypothetical protein n=1 Tax=Isoptericola croceus TaxID=3031406 RepID=UPI0023F9BF7D|nr:hypothetical protein [Isoptericola croceus]